MRAPDVEGELPLRASLASPFQEQVSSYNLTCFLPSDPHRQPSEVRLRVGACWVCALGTRRPCAPSPSAGSWSPRGPPPWLQQPWCWGLKVNSPARQQPRASEVHLPLWVSGVKPHVPPEVLVSPATPSLVMRKCPRGGGTRGEGEDRGRHRWTQTQRINCGLLSSPCPPPKPAQLTPGTPEKEQAEPLVDVLQRAPGHHS